VVADQGRLSAVHLSSVNAQVGSGVGYKVVDLTRQEAEQFVDNGGSTARS